MLGFDGGFEIDPSYFGEIEGSEADVCQFLSERHRSHRFSPGFHRLSNLGDDQHEASRDRIDPESVGLCVLVGCFAPLSNCHLTEQMHEPRHLFGDDTEMAAVCHMSPTPYPPLTPHWMEMPMRPGTPDLIPGLLKRHGVLALVGEHEVGKTLISLEIAHAAITGEPLWGELKVIQTIPRVLYFLGEHDVDQVKEQWGLTGRPFPLQTLAIIGSDQRQILVKKGERMEGSINQYKEWAKGFGLVIFDPLSAYIAGENAENDAIAMRTLINAAGEIGEVNGAAVIFVHHMGKPVLDPRGRTYEHRPKYASRGASSIEDAVLFGFYVQEGRGEGHYTHRLQKFKFKGQAPKFHYLRRDPTTLLHTWVREWRSKLTRQLPEPPIDLGKTTCD